MADDYVCGEGDQTKACLVGVVVGLPIRDVGDI